MTAYSERVNARFVYTVSVQWTVKLSWRIVTHVCLCAAVSAVVQISHWGNAFLQKEKEMVGSVGTTHCLVTSPVAHTFCSQFLFILVHILPKLWLNKSHFVFALVPILPKLWLNKSHFVFTLVHILPKLWQNKSHFVFTLVHILPKLWQNKPFILSFEDKHMWTLFIHVPPVLDFIALVTYITCRKPILRV
jgi:hypothetical protein